jgi:hypothetical protein
MDRTGMGIRTVEHTPNTFNRAPPLTIMPVLVEVVLKYIVNNPQADTMTTLPAGKAYLGTETVLVWLSTIMPHVLTPLFIEEHRLPKAKIQVIVLVLVKQDLLLEFKPLVDWLRVSVGHDNAAYVLSLNPDTLLLAVDNVLMDHR